MKFIKSLGLSTIVKLGRILGPFILLFGAQQAAAVPTPPLSCAGVFNVGGCAPFGQVIYGTGTAGNLFSGSLYEYDDVVLDYSVTGASATVRGVVDLASGKLRVFAEGIEDGNPSTGVGGFIIASATDVFTLHSAATGPVTFSVVMTADGAGTITNPGYSGQATLQLGVPGGGAGDFDIGQYQSGVFPIPDVEFALLSTLQGSQGNQLRASDTHTVQLNQPFSLGYSLRVDVSQNTSFDLSSVEALRFVLPAGVSVTSLGGFASPVPMPAPVWLFSSGLLTLLLGSRRSRSAH